MSIDLCATYYQKTKKKLQRCLRKEKNNMVANDIKIVHKLKNKG